MDTALQSPQETLGTEVPETNKKQQLPGGVIITHGVPHFNPLEFSELHPDDQNFPISS